MATPNQPPNRAARPKQKTPAERAEEFAGAQRRMKEEAAERRAAAAGGKAKKPPPKAPDA